MSEIAICPECAAGKCFNCNGQAWDDEEDRPVACTCWVDGHLDYFPE